jgi:hypothetical protein
MGFTMTLTVGVLGAVLLTEVLHGPGPEALPVTFTPSGSLEHVETTVTEVRGFMKDLGPMSCDTFITVNGLAM